MANSQDDMDVRELLKRKPENGTTLETQSKKQNTHVAKTGNEETRVKSVILNEVMYGYNKDQQLSIDQQKEMIDFAYRAHVHLMNRENSELSLAIKIDSGFRQTERILNDMMKRIEFLERNQKEEVKKGSVKLGQIEEKCEQVRKATVPSPAEKTWSLVVQKFSSKKNQEELLKEKNESLPTSNRFSVLEIEGGTVKNDSEVDVIRKEMYNRFKEEKIKVERIGKTKAGNVYVNYKDRAEQEKGDRILSQYPINQVKVRPQVDRGANLALRGVPKYLTEEDIRSQMAEFNGFEVCMDTDKCTLKEFGDNNRWNNTWKITVPKEVARDLLHEECKIFLGMKAVKVELWYPGHRRCVNCFSANHRANAPSKCLVKICNICSGEHHARDCRKRDRVDQHKCYVCAMNRKEDVNHLATVKDCPILIKEAEEEALKATSHIYG